MLRIIVMSIFLLSLTGCASTNWDRADTSREIVFQALNIADAITTSRIVDHPHLEEGGPIAVHFLGRQPDRSDVAVYFASRALVHYTVSRMLPEKARPYWQGFNIADAGYHTWTNCEKGIC